MKNILIQLPELVSQLKQVREIMKETIGHPSEFVRGPIYEMIDAGGKMLRPSMLILASRFGKYDSEKVLPLAAAIELLHIATLIHDDIIDNSKLRRGIETVQSKFGKDAAVYSGDYIIARSFMLINQQYDQDIVRSLSKKIVQICAGELKQYQLRYNLNISISDYIKIVTGKTAALFALSMYLGARAGGLEEKNARLFGLTGLRTGIAYQIIDDCLDYSGSDKTLLKSSQNDLKQGFYTLPIICALRDDDKHLLHGLLKTTTFNTQDIQRIYNMVIQKNGVKRAKNYALRYTKKSFKSLYQLPQCESRDILKQLFHTLLERQY